MTTYYDAINDGETQLTNTLDIGETTSFVVNDGSQLPTGGAGTSGFIVKLEDTMGNREYIECSHRSGNTVYISNRGFEGTFARTWISGSYLKNVFTKATKDEITDKILVATDAPIITSINPKTIEDKSGTIILPRTKSEYVFYDNATSGLISTNIQDAIDELDVDMGDLLYTENNYIVDSEPLTDSVDKIDMTLKDTNDTLNSHMADYASLFTTNPNAKNSIYRGKYLGNTVTVEQYTAISSGTFTDLYIGDYWTIGGINWRIAAFNYYRNTGDSLVPGNHITIVSDTRLYTHVMNDTNISTGGYTGSKMYTEGLEQAKTTIRGIFGTHLVKHRQILSNATADGKVSGWAWIDSEIELMNEVMVYGAGVFGASNLGGGSGHNIGAGKSQLPLFRLNPRMINTRESYWLRDVVSASLFAFVSSHGNAAFNSASLAAGVRPGFSIS